MKTLAVAAGAVLLIAVLWDMFETIVLPRTVTQSLRFARLFYRSTWAVWSSLARRLPDGEWRAELLGAFGPLSLIVLLGFWAICLVIGFALLDLGLGGALSAPEAHPGFGTYVYMSGVTLFTLGFGDVVPRSSVGRAVSIAEAGMGIGFLALVIGYLPVLYQAFSRREVSISLLDARAGSPPTAAELLRRHAEAGQVQALVPFLKEWEAWSAELLESHLSYPVLMYYRSQHDRESWLAALTAILDVCALVQTGLADGPANRGKLSALEWQAQMTYAMARHAVVDLALIQNAEPAASDEGRLSHTEWERIRTALEAAGIAIREPAQHEERLASIRNDYEPYVTALARRLLVTLPGWSPAGELADNWQTSAWRSARHF